MSASARRILFISSCVRGGGAGWSLYYLLKHLDRRLIEPIVLVPEQGIFRERFAALDLRVIEMPAITERTDQQRFDRVNPFTKAASIALNAVSAASTIPRLARLVRQETIDMVHCNNMLVKPIGALAAQLAGVPAILHARNLHEKRAKVLFYGTLARLPAVRLVIANSQATAVPYRRHVPANVQVVWNGIDLSDYDLSHVPSGKVRERLGIADGVPLVGFTGNLIPRKGLESLIRAAKLVNDRGGPVEFVALGRVPIGSPVDHRANYEALARDLGIADHFHFLGFEADVRPMLKDFDVLALPSLQEPFGRSIIEAMALGVPVVASRVGGIPEIIEDGKSGLLVDSGDAGQLARAISRLVSESDLRANLASAAAAKVSAEFDVERQTRRIEQLLLGLGRSGKRRHNRFAVA